MAKRKIITLVITLGLILCCIGAVQAQNQISIVVNGKTVNSDTPPMMVNNRIMVPIRVVAEALNADVQYDPQSTTISITTKKASIPNTSTTTQAVQQQCIKLNGELTTWPFWTQTDGIYIEYRDCLQLLGTKYRAPWHIVAANTKSGTVILDGKVVDVTTHKFGDYTAISLNSLKSKQLIDFTWDAKTNNLILK
ncbi:MAG: copper amine oxidase N-terminal domain-containing protein [Deltaproteobacteria bacterium]